MKAIILAKVALDRLIEFGNEDIKVHKEHTRRK